jgi:arylsulfatase A
MLPSLAAVTGASLPEVVKLDGQRSIAPRGDEASPRRWVFAEHEGKCFVRNHRWKLYNDGRFFDMDSDPDEKHDLSKDPLSAEAAAAYEELQRALNGLNFAEPD